MFLIGLLQKDLSPLEQMLNDMFSIGLLKNDLFPLDQMLNDMFPLKYKIVCFLLVNNKQYVSSQIQNSMFSLGKH